MEGPHEPVMSEKKRSSRPQPGCRDSPGGNCSCCTAATSCRHGAELLRRTPPQPHRRSDPLSLNGRLDGRHVLRSALQLLLMRQLGETAADGHCVTRSENWLIAFAGRGGGRDADRRRESIGARIAAVPDEQRGSSCGQGPVVSEGVILGHRRCDTARLTAVVSGLARNLRGPMTRTASPEGRCHMMAQQQIYACIGFA
jgi:hypothetical protein